MRCSIEGCPGEYEQRHIVHTVRRDGQVIVFEHVPAQMCTACGDVLLRAETVRRLEQMLAGLGAPTRTAPVYDYESQNARAQGA